MGSRGQKRKEEDQKKGEKSKRKKSKKKGRESSSSSEDMSSDDETPSSSSSSSSSEESSGSSSQSSEHKSSSEESEQERKKSKKGKAKKSKKGSSGGRIDWDLLEELWATEDRPRSLQDKKRIKEKKFTMSKLMKMKEHYEKENEKKGLGNAVYGKDKTPKAKRFKAMKDDGERKLHPARFESLPRVEPAKYWKKVPTSKTEIFRHLPLQHLGVTGVAETTVVKLHNRKVPIELKMLRKDPITEVKHVEDAMWNYVLLLRSLHPADHGAAIIHKVRK